MAEADDWGQILKAKYKPFEVERSIYIDSQKLANGPMMFAQYICDGLRPGDVPDNLRKIYREAVYGTNEKVKARIVSRIYSIGRLVRYLQYHILYSMDFLTVKLFVPCQCIVRNTKYCYEGKNQK